MCPQFSGWFLWAEQRCPLTARPLHIFLTRRSGRLRWRDWPSEGLLETKSCCAGWAHWHESSEGSTAAHSLSYELKMESGPLEPWIDSSLDMETWSSRADRIDVRVRDSGNKGQIKQMALSQKLSAATVLLIFLFYRKPLSRSWLTVTALSVLKSSLRPVITATSGHPLQIKQSDSVIFPKLIVLRRGGRSTLIFYLGQ